MNLICSSHKRKCEYICLNPQCYIQNKDFELVCPQCVLNGKHKSHDVVDYFLFVDSLHNTINTDININQYQQTIQEQIQKQIQVITEYLLQQQNTIQRQFIRFCQDLNREKKQALQTLDAFEKVINQQENQDQNMIESFKISQFDMQRLIHLYNGKLGIDSIIQNTQKELQTVIKAVDKIISEEHYFNDLTQTFQNTNYLINSPKKINTIDIIQKQSNLGLQRQNMGQIEDFESGRVSVIDLSTRKVIKQFTQYPDIELENYVLELIKVNSLSFICGFGDLRLYKLNPFKNTLLNKYSFEWELFHDSQIYRNRFLFLKEIDFILIYDLTQDKVVHQISISSFLTQRVIGLYFIQNSLVIITDRGKIDILALSI